MYAVRKQVEGMQHIRNLKASAKKLLKHYDNEPELWIDCIESAMRQCRNHLAKEEERKEEERLEAINEMTYREYFLVEGDGI